MSDRNPHISLPLDRLLPRVLGLSPEEASSWPESVRSLALNIASELFLVRYNPFINPDDVRESVDKRLAEERPRISGEYPAVLARGIKTFWRMYEADMLFKEELIAKLRAIMDNDCVSDRPNVLVECSTDATDLRMELPLLVIFPETTGQIVEIVRLANAMEFSLIPRGGGSGLTGGAVPARGRTVVLSLARLKEVLSIDVEQKILCAQTGVLTLNAIQAAAKKNLLFTVDPASKAASSLGGNISENAGGPFAFEYGTTLDNLLSYKMVLPSGDLIEVARRDHPRHKILPDESAVFEIRDEDGELAEVVTLSGGDIRGLGLGKDVTNKYLGGLPGVQKEGVDGIITEACFVLHEKLKNNRVLCLEFFGRSMHNAMLVIKEVVALRNIIRQQGDLVKISALEEFGTKYVRAIDYAKKSQQYEGEPMSVLILQLDSNDEPALDTAVREIVKIASGYDNVDVFVAEDAKQAELYWEDRHKLSAIAKRTSGFKINEDIVIPTDVIPEFSDFIEELNLHNLARSYRLALQKASQLNGVSQEDEFISMEMQFSTRVMRREITTKELSEQEFEVQTYYFFTDLRSRYPKQAEELEAIYEEMTATRVEVANHMHAGDGNCHVNLPVNSNDPEMMRRAMEAAEKVFEKVTELGGAVSGEHGIGITKIGFLSDEKIKALRAYKHKIDHKNILNPGKLTQRGLDVEPYTFSFNRLIQDLKKTALPDKERLIDLLTNIQVCTRCGKCKQVCPMYQPKRGIMFHPRNKNISLGALIEAIYYSQIQHGSPDPLLLDELRKMMDHCTGCGKCVGVCSVKIDTPETTLRVRAFLEDKDAGGHPVKRRVLRFLSDDAQGRLPVAAKLMSWGQTAQNRLLELVPQTWRKGAASPLFQSKGPHLGFKNLYETLHFDAGTLFAPENSGPDTPCVLYFPGCGAALFHRQIGMAAIYLLLRAGVSVLVPGKHSCCGYPLLSSGFEGMYLQNQQRVREALSQLIAKAKDQGFAPQTLLTACGTCRDSLNRYGLKGADGKPLPQMDVTQFIIGRLPEKGPKASPAAGDIIYHAACHSEWQGVPASKAAETYRQALSGLTGDKVSLSPGCCGESGLGAMSSPEIYNKIREQKKLQLTSDLADAKEQTPIVVGCPSCQIGIKRSLISLGKKQPVLHALEYLADLTDGPRWIKELKKLAKACKRSLS